MLCWWGRGGLCSLCYADDEGTKAPRAKCQTAKRQEQSSKESGALVFGALVFGALLLVFCSPGGDKAPRAKCQTAKHQEQSTKQQSAKQQSTKHKESSVLVFGALLFGTLPPSPSTKSKAARAKWQEQSSKWWCVKIQMDLEVGHARKTFYLEVNIQFSFCLGNSTDLIGKFTWGLHCLMFTRKARFFL